MDTKANTHVCHYPGTRLQVESRQSSSHAAYLIMIRGGLPGTMLRVGEQGTSLGRSAESTFQLFDITASRRHAFVWMDSLGSLYLRDEGSTNGTFLNGQRLEAH